MKQKDIYTRLAIFFGIILLLNYLANRLFFRLDFTADKRYTLSSATLDILSELKTPVTIKAYFSENLPPDIGIVRRDFHDQLIEFEQRSKGKVVYEFINPNESEESEGKAQQAGIQPVLVNIRERDQIKQQRAYLGAVVNLGDGSEVIPVIRPGGAMEYAVATAIKKLSVKDKPKVAILQGHGEPSLEAIMQAKQELDILYDIEELKLTDTTAIPQDKYKTIAIIAPKDTFPSLHLEQLDMFLKDGGNIFVALNRVEGNLKTLQGEAKNIGIESWLSQKGITVEDNFLLDIKCGAVSVRQQQSFFQFNTQVSFPYFPVISNFTEHPVTKGLEGVFLPFASNISITKNDSSVKIFPIAKTSKESSLQKAPVYINVMQQWKKTDFPQSEIPVAVVATGQLAGSSIKKSKMIVVGDGDFAVNGEGESRMQLQPDNVSLLVNSIDWLSDDTGLIELRTKGVTSRPLETLEDGTKTMLKYTNLLAPMVLIILYGFIRYQRQAKRRQQWLEDR